MSERDVVFNLKASADPRAVQAAKEFESLLMGSQKRVLKSEADFDKERVRIGKAASEALLKFATDNREAILRDAELMKAGSIRIAQATAKELNRVDAAQVASEKAAAAKAQSDKARQQRASDAKAATDAKADLAKRLADFKAAKREEERVLRESLKRKADDERAANRLGQQMAAMNAKLVAEEERRIALNREAIGSQGRSSQSASQRPINRSEASRQIREQFSEMGESVMRVARGFTMLGLVGEKDMDKVRDAILRAQSAFDIFGGGLKIINKLERAWDGYRKMILAATAAQAAHSAVANAGALSSLGSGAASLFRSAAASRTAAAAAGVAAGGLGLSSYGAGGAAAGAGAGGGAAAAGGIVAPVLAGAAAVGGVLFGLAGAIGAARNAINNGVGAGAKQGSYTDYIGGAKYNPFAALIARGERASLAKSNKATTKAETASQFISARNERIDGLMSTALSERGESKSKLDSITSSVSENRIANAKSSLDVSQKSLEVESKIAAIRNRMNTATTASAKIYLATQLAAQESILNQLASSKAIADDAAKVNAINAQRAKEEQKIYSLRKQIASLGDEDKELRDTLRGEMTGSANKLLELTQRRGEAEKAIAETRAASARTALDASRKELENVTSRIKSEKDALLTAEERFGMMSRGDQKEVMQLLQKARAGVQLDPGQISKLKSLGTTEAERLGSAQARNLAKGDYSGESKTLTAIDEANRRLRSNILDITQGKTNEYGVNPGAPRMLSRRQKQEVEAASYQIEANDRRAEQIRMAADRDTAMRRSIFGEERGRLAESLNQRQSIEARISQQLTVVARFDNTAKQVADMAVRQLLEAQAPWISEFERRLKETMTSVGQLQNQRRQMAPGRG